MISGNGGKARICGSAGDRVRHNASSTLDNTAVLTYLPKAKRSDISTSRRKGKAQITDKKRALTERSKSERDVVERCKAGDRQAFNELIRAHQRKVFNLCFRILGNHHEAEDVAQDVFVTVFKAIKSFRGDSAFSTWLHRVAVNNCKNRLKYLRRRRYFQTESIQQTYDTGEGEVVREIGDEDGISPDEAQSRGELNEEIQSAINGLDDDYKIVIVMRDVQGFSYQEISDALDLKEGTVKSRIHRARMELKHKLRHLINIEELRGSKDE